MCLWSEQPGGGLWPSRRCGPRGRSGGDSEPRLGHQQLCAFLATLLCGLASCPETRGTCWHGPAGVPRSFSAHLCLPCGAVWGSPQAGKISWCCSRTVKPSHRNNGVPKTGGWGSRRGAGAAGSQEKGQRRLMRTQSAEGARPPAGGCSLRGQQSPPMGTPGQESPQLLRGPPDEGGLSQSPRLLGSPAPGHSQGWSSRDPRLFPCSVPASAGEPSGLAITPWVCSGFLFQELASPISQLPELC